jgi:hypothetical protein
MCSSGSTHISPPWSARSNAEVGGRDGGREPGRWLAPAWLTVQRPQREISLASHKPKHMPVTARCGRRWRLLARPATDPRAARCADRLPRSQPSRWVSGGVNDPPVGSFTPPHERPRRVVHAPACRCPFLPQCAPERRANGLAIAPTSSRRFVAHGASEPKRVRTIVTTS